MNEFVSSRIQELKKRFVEALPEHLAQMRAHLGDMHYPDRHDAALKALHFMAHRYHGNAKTFGFPEITVAARELEKALDARMKGNVPESFPDIERLFAVLAEHFEQAKFSPEPVHVTAEVKKPAGQYKLLICDDDTMLVQSLTQKLKPKGYSLSAVNTGQELLDSAANLKPDLIILDYLLPDMDGSTVLQRLKAQSITSRIPVVILSARRNDKLIRSCRAMGAADYIIKPIFTDDFLSRIAAILKGD